MATKAISVKELADAILKLFDFDEKIYHVKLRLRANDIQKRLEEEFMIYTSPHDVADALVYLIHEKAIVIESTSIYVVETPSFPVPVISCFVRKSQKKTSG